MFVQYENLGGPCYLTLGNIEEQRISHPAGYKQGCYAAGREQNQNSNRRDHGFFFLNKGVWQITHKHGLRPVPFGGGACTLDRMSPAMTSLRQLNTILTAYLQPELSDPTWAPCASTRKAKKQSKTTGSR